MKKTLKKLASVALAGALCLSAVSGLAACGGDGDGDTAVRLATPTENVKIGVLVADNTGSEALAFASYYQNYIHGQYPNVTFLYSNALQDAEGEKAAIENFVTNNCKAIISFASADRPSQIEACEDAGIFYAVATGVLKDEDFEEYKDYKYFVGCIGPSNDVEFQAGYDMGKWAIEKGYNKFAMFGGTVAYRDDMHTQRAAGMLVAYCEDAGTTYAGASDRASIVGKLMQDGDINPSLFVSNKYQLTGAMVGFPDESNPGAFFQSAGVMAAGQPDVLLAVGVGLGLFGQFGFKIADIDSFTADYVTAMQNGTVEYLAGKYASSIGPIFAATMSAIYGAPIRDNGNAFTLGQGYLVATTAAKCAEYSTADSGTTPIISKTDLDKYIGYAAYDDVAAKTVTLNELKAFVESK